MLALAIAQRVATDAVRAEPTGTLVVQLTPFTLNEPTLVLSVFVTLRALARARGAALSP
jgi:hypothetical protein